MNALRPGEINVHGLGKRYWFRSLSRNAAADDVEVDAADVDDEIEDEALSFFRGRRMEIWGLRDLTFRIQPGERVAIVGANGSGKSTLIRILSRTLPPSEGLIEGAGIVIPFAALKSPISPQVSGVENLRVLGRLLGISLSNLDERMPDIVEFSELGQLAFEKVSRYSDAAFARLSIAMALLVDADIFLIDDAVKAGDEKYRAKVQAKFEERLLSGITLVYASNNTGLLRQYCRRALWLDHGQMIADGEVNDIVRRFLAASGDYNEFAEFEDTHEDGDDRPVETGPVLASTIISSERLEPERDWASVVAQAGTAWEKVLARRREKLGPVDLANAGTIVGNDAATLAHIEGLWCLNSDGSPIRRILPGEDVRIELLVKTLEPDVEISVRLELDAEMLVFVAEPTIPFVGRVPGQFLFRAEVGGDLLASLSEDIRHKFRTRVLFERGTTRELINATVWCDVLGGARRSFDERRHQQGAPATSILQPAPAYVQPPHEIEGWNEEQVGSKRTRWENLNRRPALRPKLPWMVYRVNPAKAAPGQEPHEKAPEMVS